jgi:holo-[acyl-carrier protein] synthase
MNVVGIGTDIIECLRIAQMIQRHGELFLTRVYTPHEIEYCSARKASTQHYAGRFAAKEAVLKALGTGWTRGIHWRDIEVRNELGGRPRILLGGGARELCEKVGIAEMLISISHCRTHATAYALALGRKSMNEVYDDLIEGEKPEEEDDS